MLSRSKHLTAICIGILCLLTLSVLIESRARAAEIYPSSPVTIVCPYAAGGGMDTTLRILGSFLQKDLGV